MFHVFIFITFLHFHVLGGKDDDGSIPDVLKLNKETMDWQLAGKLNQSRYGHSVTILRKFDVEPFCLN